MRVAFICSNYYDMKNSTANGTAIFNYSLIEELAKQPPETVRLTAFASGSSVLPVPVESVSARSSSANPELIKDDKHAIFEMALLSKGFSQAERFDLYHVNFGDGDLAMPFSPFVR